MAKIISANKAVLLSRGLKKIGKSIVLAGGCFDVLHPGHVIFLEKAGKAGDILFVLLESDRNVEKLKGENRPVHNQKMRAKVLSALEAVDYVISLPYMSSDDAYDQLMQKIKPDFIALTKDYGSFAHHKRVADLTGAKLKYVTKKVGNHSTSRILEH